MAFRIEIIGNYLVCTDNVANEEVFSDHTSSIIVERSPGWFNFFSVNKNAYLYGYNRFSFANIVDENDAAFASEAALELFLRENTGSADFSTPAGGSAGLSEDNVFTGANTFQQVTMNGDLEMDTANIHLGLSWQLYWDVNNYITSDGNAVSIFCSSFVIDADNGGVFFSNELLDDVRGVAYRSLEGDPTVAELPVGYAADFRNTLTGICRRFINNDGIIEAMLYL